MRKLIKNDSGFSAVIIILLLVIISLISFAAWRIHNSNQKKHQALLLQQINIERPTKQKEVIDYVSKMDFKNGSLLASSKVDSCFEEDVHQADFTVGSQHKCYYRQKLFVGYMGSPTEITGDVEAFAETIGFEPDRDYIPGLGYQSLTDNYCYTLVNTKLNTTKYMTVGIAVVNLTVQPKNPTCVPSGFTDNNQIDAQQQTYKTDPTFTIKELVDEDKVLEQAKQSGMKSLLTIIVDNPIGYY